MSERFSYDAPKLTRDEATELCVYHLRCAAGLFQLVPDDENEALRAEILRQCKDDIDTVDVKPAMLWAAAMYAAYDEMKDRD
jgi:hypothetical protein